MATTRCPLGGIISVCETPEQLGGLPSIMKANIDKALSSKWVEFKVYPFKEALPRTLYFFPEMDANRGASFKYAVNKTV